MKLRTILWLLAAAVFAAAVYELGIAPRVRQSRELAAEAREAGRSRVRTIVAQPRSAAVQLILPGNLQAYADTPIYARTSGYVAKWLVDLGDRVKSGQTLAIIDSPEVDQELNQARANREQAKANLTLANVSAQRWQSLAAKDAVAQQDVDTKEADLKARTADLAAAEANVQRLEQMKSFETVTAPFDGVISARNIDVGNLISPGGGTELFHLSQSQVLRVFVDVPQSNVEAIRVGLPVSVAVPEFPRERFAGKVVRFAGALDPLSRTLRTEVQIPNQRGRLFAGMYCELHFEAAPSATTLIIPSNDVIVRAEGTLVAVVTPARRIHLQAVTLGRDYGTQIEILDGLSAGAHIVENPNDALAEGAQVEEN